MNLTTLSVIVVMVCAAALAARSHFITSSDDYVHLAIAALGGLALLFALALIIPWRSAKEPLAIVIGLTLELLLWHPWLN